MTINNVLKEELDFSVVAKFATTATDGKMYQVEYYNLDMFISVGYRVKSKRGIAFCKWANAFLKDYNIKGYAANLLYFIVKNRSFSDGNKRIAAAMFLYFLDRNGVLFNEGEKLIDDHTLVALTIMMAESRPEEKEMMISVIMNCIARENLTR